MTRYRDNGQTAAVAPTPTQTDKERADNLPQQSLLEVVKRNLRYISGCQIKMAT
jgi:hypothetical protein